LKSIVGKLIQTETQNLNASTYCLTIIDTSQITCQSSRLSTEK
jgi:hypothetical protein